MVGYINFAFPHSAKTPLPIGPHYDPSSAPPSPSHAILPAPNPLYSDGGRRWTSRGQPAGFSRPCSSSPFTCGGRHASAHGPGKITGAFQQQPHHQNPGRCPTETSRHHAAADAWSSRNHPPPPRGDVFQSRSATIAAHARVLDLLPSCLWPPLSRDGQPDACLCHFFPRRVRASFSCHISSSNTNNSTSRGGSNDSVLLPLLLVLPPSLLPDYDKRDSVQEYHHLRPPEGQESCRRFTPCHP